MKSTDNRIPLVEGDDLISKMEAMMGCRYEENDMRNPTITALTGMVHRVVNDDGVAEPDRDDFARGTVIEGEGKRDGLMDFLVLALAMR